MFNLARRVARTRQHITRLLVGISLLFTTVLVPMHTASADRPPKQAAYPGAASADLVMMPSGPVTAAGEGPTTAAAFSCSRFETRGDDVHMSIPDVSGHGWWMNFGCAASQADVTIRLQAYYEDGVWRYVGSTGRARVYSGGGSANRATARARCARLSGKYGFRSVVDVDLVGVNDPADVLVTRPRDLPCHL